MRVNFGPSFIKRPDIQGVNAVSELQPMNPEDRKVRDILSCVWYFLHNDSFWATMLLLSARFRFICDVRYLFLDARADDYGYTAVPRGLQLMLLPVTGTRERSIRRL